MSPMREFLLSSQRIWGMILFLAAAFAAMSCGDSQQPAYQPATPQFTTLYSFKGNPDGVRPTGGLIRDSAGTLYGTTYGGGTTGRGAIFALDRFGNESVIHSLSDDDDGMGPMAGLAAGKDGNFYGTTYGGGTSFFWGTLFKVDASGNHTVLVNFHDSNGASPLARLIQGEDGFLYGTTYVGGGTWQICIVNGCGVVFKTDTQGQETVLHNFTGVPDGWGPNELVLDEYGNLYGTTRGGGSASSYDFSGSGTIYEVDPTGQETVLYRFTGGADGAHPTGGLIRDSAGNFYGTAATGGASDNGVIFSFDSAGNLTVLHSFAGGPGGANPNGGLIWGANGKLYGNTISGGDYGYGAIFELDRSGAYRVLHSFTGGADGARPVGSLMLGQGNVMYGATSGGGTTAGPCTGTNWQGCGTIFSIVP